ncbi:MAG: chromosomal replication initiator protein DnaA [Deltaproteobacteria bacterium RIFOXYD12_FULL_57_12]|nr:MAG: chromosomal replication initiator protein DnaA [Deltaproteobacteria bacterium RIFOXYD12_FULL_57_12]
MLWERIKESLRGMLPETTYSLWIEPIVCVKNSDDQQLELACPDRFFSTWVTDNYLEVINSVLGELGSPQVKLRFSVLSEPQRRPAGKESGSGQLRLPDMPAGRSFIRNLHPRYTFDEFMVGESNQLAQSACQALASGDTSLGSCLYINAGTGLGKSHLTHAVAHNIVNSSPGTRLHYLTAQQFSAEMVSRIKTNSMEAFKDKYHNHCDMLLLEDIHNLTGKAKTQEELNEVLDSLLKAGKRVVFTGVSAPRELAELDAELRSRMAAGLIATINPPDLRTRRRIIRRKALNSNLTLAEELIDYLAQHLNGDVRRVESAIVGLKAKSALLKKAPDGDMVKEVVLEIMGRPRELSAETIRDFLAEQFKVSIAELQSRSRKKTIAFPRQVSMYLARRCTNQGLADIGKAFNRDHSTVLHSIRVITEEMARSGSVRGQVELLAEKLTK